MAWYEQKDRLGTKIRFGDVVIGLDLEPMIFYKRSRGVGGYGRFISQKGERSVMFKNVIYLPPYNVSEADSGATPRQETPNSIKSLVRRYYEIAGR